MARNVYTVKQVNSYIKNMFTQDFMLNRIYVKGEVSNCKYHTSGHIYFSLKDESGTIACVMFAGQRGGLSFHMREGQQIIVLGSVNVYERTGSYQLYAQEIRLDGEGRLFAGPEEIPLTDVKERVKHFIANPDNEESLPEKHSREVPLLGTVEVTDTHVIALRYDPHTDYRTYFEVQNLLLEAYRELRDAEAEKRFHCTFDRASSEQQEAIRACYPQRISETMTAEEKGGRD